MFQLRPITKRRLQRFHSLKRGWYAFLFLSICLAFTVLAEVFINSRALYVQHEGKSSFPTYGDPIPGKVFGLGYGYETDYKELQAHFAASGSSSKVIMPLIPWGPNEMDYSVPPPAKPSAKHWLGTDIMGRDILSRLVYGFRVSISFALLMVGMTYSIGVTLGCLSGYYGSWIDLITQRLQEIWMCLPFLFIVIIITAFWSPGFVGLAFICAIFSWMGIASTMRAMTFKEKSREYVTAARSLGAGTGRIVFRHILPNTLSIVISSLPFQVAGGISALTSLDFLGYGVPPPMPSWGELMEQGLGRLDAWWILGSVATAMTIILISITFIGEGLREAFDPKRHSTYD